MPKCICPDWRDNINKLDAPIILAGIRNGRSGYTGKRFTHCPWCGCELTLEASDYAVHADPAGKTREPPHCQLLASLEAINQARLTWAMACPHDDCGACQDFDAAIRAALPQTCEHTQQK